MLNEYLQDGELKDEVENLLFMGMMFAPAPQAREKSLKTSGILRFGELRGTLTI